MDEICEDCLTVLVTQIKIPISLYLSSLATLSTTTNEFVSHKNVRSERKENERSGICDDSNGEIVMQRDVI